MKSLNNNNNNNSCKLISNLRIIKFRRSLHLHLKPRLHPKSLILIQDSVPTSMNTSMKIIRIIRSLLGKKGMLPTKMNTKIPKRLMMRFTVILKELILGPPRTTNFYSTLNHKTNFKAQTWNQSAGVISHVAQGIVGKRQKVVMGRHPQLGALTIKTTSNNNVRDPTAKSMEKSMMCNSLKWPQHSNLT